MQSEVTHYIFDDGKEYARIPFGQERDYWLHGSDTCADCGCLYGSLHVEYCDQEECPRCGGQLLGCLPPSEEMGGG